MAKKQKKTKFQHSPFFEDVFAILDNPDYWQIELEQKMEELKNLLQKNKVKTDLEIYFEKGKYKKQYLWNLR